VAFSGAEEFVEKFKDVKDAKEIIGQFGLGFYSAFMVADNVEIITRSQQPNSQAVHWSCDGSPNYTLVDVDKKTKGTDIVLHIAEDSKEFLSQDRIQGVLDKYCKFLPVHIKFGKKSESIEDGTDDEGKTKWKSVEVDNIVNNPAPAWTKAPADLKDEDYNSFYKELYPANFDDPIFSIHLNVDYPFNLTGILYFPKLKQNFEANKNKINLYSNQVFITDNVENIVPEFLTLLHGVIDSPDIPLNVSRSYLQSDHNVQKISNHIQKKVGDRIEKMFKDDRADFEAKWEDIKVFIEYGMLTQDKFADKMEKCYLVKDTDGNFFTMEEVKEKVEALQKDKNEKVILLYTHNAEEHHGFIAQAKGRGYTVLVMDSPLTSHMLMKLEQRNNEISFTRVDSNTIDKLIDKGEEMVSKLSKEQEEALKPLVEGLVDSKKYQVELSAMSADDAPMMITQSEFMRRMKEQQESGGGGMMMGAFPEMYNLVVNSNHPLVAQIAEEKEEAKQKTLTEQALDLAMLSQGMLKGERLTSFINRSIELIK
jgi:molecular chaperone HtpG